MSEKQKRQTISLAVIMVICVVLSALLLSNSLQCAECGKKITGKYYISLFEKPYCKDCGAEYYRGFPGDLDSVTDRVDNTARNILIIVELIGFIGAMVVVNKKKVTETIKSDGVASVTRKIPVIKEEVKKVVEPIVKKETPIESKPEIKPEVKVEKVPEVRTEVKIEKTPASTEVRSGLRTTFKPKTEEPISFPTFSISSSSEENKRDWFQSAGDL